MMKGDADIISGWRNKLEVAVSNITPNTVLAERHRKTAEPGSAGKTLAGSARLLAAPSGRRKMGA